MEEIVKKFKSKHGTLYSVEKLNIWAHMLHIEKHGSLDVPPNVPYFTRAHQSSQQKSVSQSTSSPVTIGPVSPGKRVSLRTECMEQLSKWHSLLEKHVITQNHYDKVQQTILKDLMDDDK